MLNVSAKNAALIDGIIENNGRDSIYIFLQENFMSPQISYRSKIGASGDFKLTIPVMEQRQFYCEQGMKLLYYTFLQMIQFTAPLTVFL